jgi:hypothetical protein
MAEAQLLSKREEPARPRDAMEMLEKEDTLL